MSVEVKDGRIHWIGSSTEWRGNRSGVRVIDGRARTLIPGLMDCHVHYCSPGGPDWIERFTDSLPEISTRALVLAKASLRSGVTTAREVGAPHGVNIRLARSVEAGEVQAPHIQAAGTWIAHRGTYVSFARQFEDAKELRHAIRAEIEAGADLIKVALAGWNEGARPDGASEIPFDEKLLAVAVDEAHKAKFKIACHANDTVSCGIAARAGVDSLEHGMFLSDADLDVMEKNGTFLVPTMSVWDAMQYYARVVDWPKARRERADGLKEASRRAVSTAIKKNVKIALGTDAGGGAARHGRIAREAELMVESGMTPSKALTAGTASAAALIGEPDRGTIQQGKIADMILLDANPIENVGALRMIVAVYQAGRSVE